MSSYLRKRMILVVGISLLFIFLVSCWDEKAQPFTNGMKTDPNDPNHRTNQGGEVKMAGNQPVSILDIYEQWNGQLICKNQMYIPESIVYYSGEFVECEIRLSSERGLNTTTDDLRMLEEKYVSVEVEEEGMARSNERFDYMDFSVSADHPNLLKFSISPPKHPVKVSFTSSAGKEAIDFYFKYAEPLTYSISRPFEADGNDHTTGIRQYLQVGQSHIYNISFSQPVDKDSVKQMLDAELGTITKRIEWLTDHSLTLTLQLVEADLMEDYDEYRLNFTRVKTQSGWVNDEWQANQTVFFQPTNRKYFYKNHLLDGTEEPLFNSLISYSSLDVSANGKWILAMELSSNQSVFITSYSLLDHNGKRLKEMTGVRSPVWLPDGNSLLYAERNSVIRYEISTGEKHVVWSDSEEPTIMSFEYHQTTGRLLVAKGVSDSKGGVPIDLYLFDSINDDMPRLLKKALYNQDDIGWSGLNYALPVHFIGNERIYLESFKPDGQSGEYKRIRSIMEWGSSTLLNIDMNGELYPMNAGHMLHGENGIWTVYVYTSGEETPLDFKIGNREWLAIKEIQEGIILLSVSNVHHSILNLNTMSLQKTSGNQRILSNRAWNSDVISVGFSE